MSPKELPTIRCHYEVLGVAQDADASVVKKAHRKLALKFHPDKNHGDDTAAEKFRLVQQAYEVLSDSQERKWYDDHRDAILAGWSAGGSRDDAGGEMLFEVVHYMHPGCYSGYHDNEGGFFNVFTQVFQEIVQLERRQTQVSIELPTDFGNSETNWTHVLSFYQTWESFVSQLNFAWEDKFNANEDAPNRRVRRLMEEDNKKARRNAKKSYIQDILALVAFVKRRDPRVKAKQEESKQRKEEQLKKQKEEALERKLESKRAKEAWREQAHHDMKNMEEEDRLAGRVRLADLEDDYDYGGKKRGGKKKNKRRVQVSEKKEDEQNETQSNDENEAGDAGGGEGERVEAADVDEARDLISQERTIGKDLGNSSLFDTDDVDAFHPVVGEERPIVDDNSSTSEDSGPDIWCCECCGKDFKSEGQMSNHMKSKKHKENYKKFLAMIKREEEEIMGRMMVELDLKERSDL